MMCKFYTGTVYFNQWKDDIESQNITFHWEHRPGPLGAVWDPNEKDYQYSVDRALDLCAGSCRFESRWIPSGVDYRERLKYASFLPLPQNDVKWITVYDKTGKKEQVGYIICCIVYNMLCDQSYTADTNVVLGICLKLLLFYSFKPASMMDLPLICQIIGIIHHGRRLVSAHAG